MPGEIFGDIRNASDNSSTPTVNTNSNFAALVAQLRYRRLQVAENVVESCGEFDSLAADRVFTTAGSRKFRSYSSLPEPLRFIGIENTPPNITRTTTFARKERKTLADQQLEVSSQLETQALTCPEQSSQAVGVDKHSSPTSDQPIATSVGLTSTDETSQPDQQPTSVIYHPLLDDPEPSDGRNQKPSAASPLMVDVSLLEEPTLSASHQHTDGNPSACETPLAYEWPVEGAKMLYASPQQLAREGKRSSPGSVADSQDSWRISSTNAILTAPPPVAAALEAAESLVNFATASITALSTSSQDFIDRSTLSLKDAAARSHMTWQQAISKVGQALLTARTAIETPRLAAPEEALEEEEQDHVPPLLKRAVSISTTVKTGLTDAVQQAKDILRNI